jgi:HSP20 family protein
MALPVRRREAPRSATPQSWQSFRELDQLQEATAQLMESMFAGDGAAPWTPPVDIEETDDAWHIAAELPGAASDDINVDVHDNEVAITGEIKQKERKGILRRRTRRVGEFEFRVTLPGPIDPEALDARLDDGVLSVTVPKPEQARPRRIEVQQGRA